MNESIENHSPRARAKARLAAVQALYQWLITERPMAEIIPEFEQDKAKLKQADKDYFRDVLRGSEKNSVAIADVLIPFLDRTLAELDPVTRAILHLGAYELKYRPELPRRVILNEAVKLARRFGAEDSYKYINGVLDRAARHLREDGNGESVPE